MKKLFIGSVLLLGCGRSISRFDTPFIVAGIIYKEQGICQYLGQEQEADYGSIEGWSGTPIVIDSCGKYNIGDTIKLR